MDWSHWFHQSEPKVIALWLGPYFRDECLAREWKKCYRCLLVVISGNWWLIKYRKYIYISFKLIKNNEIYKVCMLPIIYRNLGKYLNLGLAAWDLVYKAQITYISGHIPNDGQHRITLPPLVFRHSPCRSCSAVRLSSGLPPSVRWRGLRYWDRCVAIHAPPSGRGIWSPPLPPPPPSVADDDDDGSDCDCLLWPLPCWEDGAGATVVRF